MSLSQEVDPDRVLVWAPAGRDAALTVTILKQAGIAGQVCPGLDAWLRELDRGAGAAVVAEEAFTREAVARTEACLAGQPSWSDLPLIVFTARQATARENLRALEVLSRLGNVTALERPIHPATLVSAVRTALRARGRQYEARRALERRETEVRQRDQFLAMLGHELRNPLAAIRHAVELLDRIADQDPHVEAKVQRPVGVIDRQLHHLTRLVDDLLDVARVTSGKIVLKSVPTDLVVLVRAAVDELVRENKERQHQLVLRAPETAVAVQGDPVRLHQILTNLLTNAVKYTPPGGQIEVTLVEEKGWAVLRVADNGVGISAHVLPTIFELFTQAERTLERSQGGMGLGLAVVRTLVDLHGGQVVAESAGLGQGSVFTIRLPMISEAAIARVSSAQPVAQSRPPRHVLLVEDSVDVREGLQELLEDLGHRVDVAADGAEGIERALALRPQVALVDIGLPVLDGYEVARRMRAALGTQILLVALTGYGQAEDAERARAAGFDIHLRKPVSIDDVEEVLAAAAPRSDQSPGTAETPSL